MCLVHHHPEPAALQVGWHRRFGFLVARVGQLGKEARRQTVNRVKQFYGLGRYCIASQQMN